MVVNVNNAFVGSTKADKGVFFRAPQGTPGPKHALDRLHDLFEDHGTVGPEGLTVAQTRDTNDIKMLGGGTFIDVQTAYDESMTIKLLEDDLVAVLKTSYGDANVEVTEATGEHGVRKTIYHTKDPLPISSFVVILFSGLKTKMYYVENGRVSNIAEVKDAHDNVTDRTLTIKTFEPTSLELKGGNVVEYRDDGRPQLPPTALTVTTDSLEDGKVGTAYSQTLVASGGTGGKTWAVETGNLPAGLAIAAGKITGTPTAAGSRTFTVKVTDSAEPPATATQELTIVVAA